VIVAISGDEIAVSLDTGHGYDGPDVTDDLCRRARELYRLALHDHLDEQQGEHTCAGDDE
jgi:hypothetical protein